MIFPFRNHPGEKAFSDAVNVFNSAELTRQEEILLRGLKVARLLIGTYCRIEIIIDAVSGGKDAVSGGKYALKLPGTKRTR